MYAEKLTFPQAMDSYDAVTSFFGYHKYMDNFYTSPKHLSGLFAMKFGGCGTYRDYSHGMQLSSHSQNNLPGDPLGGFWMDRFYL